jgi:hypothetical protein
VKIKLTLVSRRIDLAADIVTAAIVVTVVTVVTADPVGMGILLAMVTTTVVTELSESASYVFSA